MNKTIIEITNELLSKKIKNRMLTKDKTTITEAINNVLSKLKYGESTMLHQPFISNNFNKNQYLNFSKYIEDDIDILYEIGKELDNRISNIETTISNIISSLTSYSIMANEKIKLVSMSSTVDKINIFDTNKNNILNASKIGINNNMYVAYNNIARSFMFLKQETCNLDIICFNTNIIPVYQSDSTQAYLNNILKPYYKTYYIESIENVDSFGVTITDDVRNKFIVGVIMKFNGFVTLNEIELRMFTNNNVSFYKMVYTNKYTSDIDVLKNLKSWNEISNIKYHSSYSNTYHVFHTDPFICRTLIIFFTLNNPMKNHLIQETTEVTSYNIVKDLFKLVMKKLDTNETRNVLESITPADTILTKSTEDTNEYIFGISHIAANYNVYLESSYYQSDLYTYSSAPAYSIINIDGFINAFDGSSRLLSEYLLDEPEYENDNPSKLKDKEYINSFIYSEILYGNDKSRYLFPAYNSNRLLPIYSQFTVSPIDNSITLFLPFKIDVSTIDNVVFINGNKLDNAGDYFKTNIINGYRMYEPNINSFHTGIGDPTNSLILSGNNQIILYARPLNDMSIIRYSEEDNIFIKDDYNKLTIPELYIIGLEAEGETPATIIKRLNPNDYNIIDNTKFFIIKNIENDPLSEFKKTSEVFTWEDQEQPDATNGYMFSNDSWITYSYTNEAMYATQSFDNLTCNKNDQITLTLNNIYIYNTITVYINDEKFIGTIIYPNEALCQTATNITTANLKQISIMAPHNITESDIITVLYIPLKFNNSQSEYKLYTGSITSNITNPDYQTDINITTATETITLTDPPYIYDKLVKSKTEWSLINGIYKNKLFPDIYYTPIIISYNGQTIQYVESTDDFFDYSSRLVYTISKHDIIFNEPVVGNINVSYYKYDNYNIVRLSLLNKSGYINNTNTVYSYTLSTNIK